LDLFAWLEVREINQPMTDRAWFHKNAAGSAGGVNFAV
jgi:hypothetical protein